MAFEDIFDGKVTDSVEESVKKDAKVMKEFIDFLLDDMEKNDYETLTKNDLEELREITEKVLDGSLTFDDLGGTFNGII